MTTALSADEFVEHTTAAALEEKAKLQKHFGRFDMLFFLICTLVGLDTLGSVASNGAQGFTWLVFLAAVFFIPYALLTAELGSTFTEEGGSYIWVKLAFGRFVAAIQSVLYWLSNPIWLGGSLTIVAVTTFNDFLFNLGSVGKYIFALAFIWIAVWAAILSFSIGKWIPTIGAFVRVIVLSFFTLTVIIYAASHGVHGVKVGGFSPTWAVFIAAVPVLFFNYVGFELPNAAGDEMKDPQRDVPFTVLRSAVGAVALYGVPILAILLVLPVAQVTSLGGFLDAMKTVFTVYGGHITTAKDGTVTATLTGAGKFLGGVAAVGFILALLSSGTTWIMGADRSQAVAGFDGAAPRSFGYFSARFGTPITVNLLSGLFSTIVMVLAFQAHRQRRQVLHRRARPGDLDDDDLLPGRVPGRDQAPLLAPARAAALPRAGRDARRVGGRRAVHAVVGAGDGGAAVPGLRDERSEQFAARRLDRPARGLRALAVRPARGAGGARPAVLRARRAHARPGGGNPAVRSAGGAPWCRLIRPLLFAHAQRMA